MSLYVDPKDQPANPSWPEHYKTIWERRRQLRLDHAQLTRKLEALDSYISIHDSEIGQPSGAPGADVWGVPQTTAWTTTTLGSPTVTLSY